MPIRSTSVNFSFGVASSIGHTGMRSEKQLEVLNPQCKQCFLSLQNQLWWRCTSIHSSDCLYDSMMIIAPCILMLNYYYQFLLRGIEI